MYRVIIIGSKNYSTILGVARSLGEAGYETNAICFDKRTAKILRKSIYIIESVCISDDFNELWNAVETFRGNSEHVLIIPVNDYICKMIDEHAEQFFPHYSIPNRNNKPNEVIYFMNKMHQKELAEKCGLLTAKGNCYSTDSIGIKDCLREISYPCFVKPPSSGSKMLLCLCKDNQNLTAAMERFAKHNIDKVLIEEAISITEELCLYGVAYNGKVFIPACVVTIRGGFSNHKGVTAEGKVISSSNLGVFTEQVKEFVLQSHFSGLFCIDIIRSENDLYFSEINLRSGGSEYAITQAGVNLPAALAAMVYEKPYDPPENIKQEVKFLNERIEFDALIDNYISLRDFINHMSMDCKRLTKNENDTGPWNELLMISLGRYIKRKIKKTRNKL